MKVKAIINFNDLDENKKRTIGDEFEVSKERADFLLGHKAVEIVEEIKEAEVEEIVEDAIEEVVEEEPKPKKKKNKKNKK